MKRRISVVRVLAGIILVLVVNQASSAGTGRKFYNDDPLTREPESQDASKVAPWDIDLVYDLAQNLFTRPGDRGPAPRAGNVNTIDEVPDSSWFTNRILARPVSVEEASRGPLTGAGPAPGIWSVVRPKEAGFAPGFTMRDTKGDVWFVSFDAKGFPEAATGAILVANKIFWTLGYWQVENYLVSIRLDQLVVAESATTRPPSGKDRPMRLGDIGDVLKRAQRSADGSYRAVAARAVPGRPLGGFRYYGTRPDDPNDIVPHEHRRELRALKVFGAWTNLTDMKAGNTLDSLVTAPTAAAPFVTTCRTSARRSAPVRTRRTTMTKAGNTSSREISCGNGCTPSASSWSPGRPRRTTEHPAIGRFEGKVFDPAGWKPRVPTAAFLRARNDDSFWAARRVMAFSDEMIRALVKTGQYSDPEAEALLAGVLIQRRDAIGRTFLTAINPVVNVALSDNGLLTFENAAVTAGVASAPTGGYVVEWARFDNDTGETTAALGTSASAGGLQAPGPLPSEPGAYIKVEIRAVQPDHPSWGTAVHAYFRRADGWQLVGLERMP